MLIPLHTLILKYNIIFSGILHVGAHECEELIEYEKYIDRSCILWIEAMPDKVDLCKQKYPHLLIECAIVSDSEETVKFNVSNNGQSSSILELGTHKEAHPWVHYVSSYSATSKLLKNVIEPYNIPFNFINLDIQGAELKALKGLDAEYLNKIQYIYSEVNSKYVYENCALITEIDKYLNTFGFIRVETCMTESSWGDAFYIKQSLLTRYLT